MTSLAGPEDGPEESVPAPSVTASADLSAPVVASRESASGTPLAVEDPSAPVVGPEESVSAPVIITGTFGYRLYGNAGSGGPVDYTTPIWVGSATTWTSPALAAGSNWAFGLRAFYAAGGPEEANTAATYEISLDGSYVNITAVPNIPIGLLAESLPSGGARAIWKYDPRGQPGAPLGFDVWVIPATSTAPTSGQSPFAVVPYYAGQSLFSTGPNGGSAGPDASGLTDGTQYRLVVAAYNAVGSGPQLFSAPFTARVTGPPAVTPVSATTVL